MPPPFFSYPTKPRAGLTRRALLGGTLAAVWLRGAESARALEIDVARAESSMRSRYGDRGVQALHAWLEMLQAQAGRPVEQQLVAVNDFWNKTLLGSEDMQIWGEADYWATPLESLGKRAGDCEDFVIGKYFSLTRLGVSPDWLRLVYVRARVGGVGSTQSVAHMVLGYYTTPDAEPLVLDNLTPGITPASQRQDLTPVFSFNAKGIFVGSAQTAPVERINRWGGLLGRMRQEGFTP